jgi:hypothetical protein
VDRVERPGYEVPEMVKESSRLPSLEATMYRYMKAYGMHLRVSSAEEGKSTCDSAVAATFMQPQRGTENDSQPILTAVEYTEWV